MMKLTLKHRTFKRTHYQQLRDESKITDMQNSLVPTSRPML
jgi:hypothetical protein